MVICDHTLFALESLPQQELHAPASIPMTNQEHPLLDHDTYRDARAGWVGVSTEQQKFIDQTVLTLAGGTLGLSLTFLHDFATVPRLPWLLYLGGASLVLSIISVLASLHVSQHSIQGHIEDLDSAARAAFSKASERFMERRFVNAAARFTQFVNRFASIALVVGIALVAIFAYMNLLQPKSETSFVEKIVVPPRDSSGIERGTVPVKPAVAPRPQPAPAAPQQPQTQGPKS